jgi:hypothetical protein
MALADGLVPQPQDLTGTEGRREPPPELLDRAAYRGENVVGTRSDHPNGAYNHREDYGQHNRVFRDILTILLAQPVQSTDHD